MPKLILASTSPYRRALLERLRVPFDVLPPDVDEALAAGETPDQAASRLAVAKALAVARTNPGSIVIGSDQIADLDGQAINKPMNHENALDQLKRMQGREVVFHTALAVVAGNGDIQMENVPTRVRFCRLPDYLLDRYLRLEESYDCAGSAKIEGLGIALVSSVAAEDPTALIGLPLIRLTAMLRSAGLEVLAHAH